MEEVIDWHSIPRGSAFTFVGMPSDVDIVYYLGRSLVTPLIAILESESGAIYKKPLAVLRHWPEHDKRAQPAVDEALKALETAYRAQTLSDDWVLGIGHAFLAHGDVIVATLRDQKQPPQTVAGDSFFDGKDYSAALGKIEYLLNQERQHLSFMTEENQPDYFLDPIKQDIASYEAAIELIKQAALTRHEGA